MAVAARATRLLGRPRPTSSWHRTETTGRGRGALTPPLPAPQTLTPPRPWISGKWSDKSNHVDRAKTFCFTNLCSRFCPFSKEDVVRVVRVVCALVSPLFRGCLSSSASHEQLRADKLTKTFPSGISRPTRTQASRCEKTYAFGCFNFEVRPRTRQRSAPTVQPPPKFLQTLAAAKVFFIKLYSAIAMLATYFTESANGTSKTFAELMND
jgi:hypothetical protein